MKPTFILIIFLGLSHVASAGLVCKNLFTKEYLVFFYKDQTPVRTIAKTIDFGNSIKVDGLITTSICGEVTIPSSCSQQGTAKLVFAPNEGNDCAIVPNVADWGYSHGNYENGDKFVAMDSKKSAKEGDYTVSFTFVCSLSLTNELLQALYYPSEKHFEIVLHGKEGCGYSVDFMKALSEHPMLSGGIFLAIGVVLCFFGLKFYKDMLVFFVPMMIAILCFYLYITVVEKNLQQDNRWFLIFIVLFLTLVVIALAIMFTNVVYFILCEIKSVFGQL